MISDATTLSNSQLTENLRELSIRERKITAEVVVHIAEFMRRRLYLEHGATSIFGYLTKTLKYSGSTAQNRIDAARLLVDAPTLENDLANGDINLAQISILARGFRQAESAFETGGCAEVRGGAQARGSAATRAEMTKGMIEQLRNCDARESAILVARTLDLNLKEPEKLRHQKDASVVLEVTLSKPQMEALRRAKDVASHVLPKASWAEVISFLTEDYLRRKDLSREQVTSRPAKLQRRASGVTVAEITASSQSQSVNPQGEIRLGPEKASVAHPDKSARAALPTKMKRIVMNRDQTCQHVYRDTGEVCQSTYQLQFDHVLSVSKGGRDDVANLQILCGAHNRLKYRRFG